MNTPLLRSVRPAARRCLLAAGAALLAGCASTTQADGPVVARTPVDLDPLVPAFVTRPGPTPADLLDQASRQIVTGRRAAALELMRRDPSRTLAGLSASTADSNRLHEVAGLADKALGDDGGHGWQACLDTAAENASDFQHYDEVRTALLAALRAGEVKAAVAHIPLPLPSAPPAALMFGLDARALEGCVQLAAGDAAAAQRSFADGARLAGDGRPFEHARLSLLEATALQATGAPHADAWREAVGSACRLTDVTDPVFWARALALRPADEPWPPEALALAARTVAPGGEAAAADAQGLMRGFVGLQLLAANQPTDALLALTLATADASTPLIVARLRLAQARAFIALGSPGDASANLISLSQDPDPLASCPALALLGALELKLARPERARLLLDHALETEHPDWPGRSEAEANLGLVLLTLGDPEAGLQRLHSAQAQFEVERDYDALTRCLRNELAWADQARRVDDSVRLRQRLENVERR